MVFKLFQLSYNNETLYNNWNFNNWDEFIGFENSKNTTLLLQSDPITIGKQILDNTVLPINLE